MISFNFFLNNLKQGLKSEWTETRLAVWIVMVAILFSYTIYSWCSVENVIKLGLEIGPFELGTSLCFLLSSIYFFRSFKATKSIFFLLLGFIFFFGAAEEISWGQKIIHFETPESIKKANIQDEFNIHNLHTFNTGDDDHQKKQGLARLLEFNFLFRLFCLSFGILLPLINYATTNSNFWLKRIKLPVPPLTLGVFFMINWIVFRLTLMVVRQDIPDENYYNTASETFECITSIIFLLIALSFHKSKSNQFTRPTY